MPVLRPFCQPWKCIEESFAVFTSVIWMLSDWLLFWQKICWQNSDFDTKINSKTIIFQ